MRSSYDALVDPTVQEGAPRSDRFTGKSLVLISLLIGVGCAILWNGGVGQHLAAQNLINTMALPTMKGFQSLQRTSPMATYQPQFRSVAAQVHAAEKTLQTYGVAPSPIEHHAISVIAATNRGRGARDVSMKAMAELGAKWDLVDDPIKGKLEDVLKPMKYKKNYMAGVSGPLGYFDPLAYSTQCSTGKLLFYREVELKHGRLAMLASLGILVGENFHPLFGGNIDTAAIYAFQETPLQTFWGAVVLAIAIPEVYSIFTFQEPGKVDGSFAVTGEQWTIKNDHLPGDLGFDPLGLKPTDDDEFVEMQTKELNNGRLAMIAAAGMIAQELVDGQKIFH